MVLFMSSLNIFKITQICLFCIIAYLEYVFIYRYFIYNVYFGNFEKLFLKKFYHIKLLIYLLYLIKVSFIIHKKLAIINLYILNINKNSIKNIIILEFLCIL